MLPHHHYYILYKYSNRSILILLNILEKNAKKTNGNIHIEQLHIKMSYCNNYTSLYNRESTWKNTFYTSIKERETRTARIAQNNAGEHKNRSIAIQALIKMYDINEYYIIDARLLYNTR